jgi:hypothetical protein
MVLKSILWPASDLAERSRAAYVACTNKKALYKNRDAFASDLEKALKDDDIRIAAAMPFECNAPSLSSKMAGSSIVAGIILSSLFSQIGGFRGVPARKMAMSTSVRRGPTAVARQ